MLPEKRRDPLDGELGEDVGHPEDEAVEAVLGAVLGQPGREREQRDDLAPGDLENGWNFN